MRIAIFNPYKNQFAAENAADAVYKKISAVNGINLQIESFCHPQEIEKFAPDFIISHSNFTPKFCNIPTYVIINEPTSIKIRNNDDLRSYLVFDGYLTQSKKVAQALQDMCFSYNKKCNILTPFFNSQNLLLSDNEINFAQAKLAYFANNWEIITGINGKKEPRFKTLFHTLTSKMQVNYLELYGRVDGWQWIKNKSYIKGQVAFDDANKILETYKKCGIGLALSQENFYQDGLANNRVYEIIASQALCIADDLPFYREAFGDSILYITSRDEEEMARQISSHVEWVRKNPQEAKAKAQKAHEIFCEKFSAEKMLSKLLEFHLKSLESNYLTARYNSVKNPLVSVVVRSGGRSREMVEQTIKSLVAQTYKEIELVFVLYQKNQELYDLANSYRNYFNNLKIIESQSAIRSSVILSGIKNCSGEFIALLDDDDIWYSNHLSKIIEFFDNAKDADLVYCGRVYKTREILTSKKKKKLPGAYFCDLLANLENITKNRSCYDLGGFGKTNYDEMMFLNHPIHPCFVVKKSSLPPKIFVDPLIHDCEDLYLTALMYKEGLKFYWMPELTMQMNIHGANSNISSQEEILIKNRIALRVHGIASWQELLDKKRYNKELARIAAKMTKLRSFLFKMRMIFKKIIK